MTQWVTLGPLKRRIVSDKQHLLREGEGESVWERQCQKNTCCLYDSQTHPVAPQRHKLNILSKHKQAQAECTSGHEEIGEILNWNYNMVFRKFYSSLHNYTCQWLCIQKHINTLTVGVNDWATDPLIRGWLLCHLSHSHIGVWETTVHASLETKRHQSFPKHVFVFFCLNLIKYHQCFVTKVA